jgi:ABC-type lipoprotein export system ATPase subunit
MQLTALGALDFLSFRRLSLDLARSDLNPIVGPNGSGKSNVFRLIQAVSEITSTPFDESRWSASWSEAVHDQSDGLAFEIYLDIELSESRERELFRRFLLAAIESWLTGNTARGGDFDSRRARLAEIAGPSHLPDRLVRGRVSVQWRRDLSPRFEVNYRCDALPNSTALTFQLYGQGYGRISGPPTTTGGENAKAWQDYLAGNGSAPEEFDLDALLARCGEIGVDLQVATGNVSSDMAQGVLSMGVLFARHVGLDPTQNRNVTMQVVFARLFAEALVLSPNIRSMPLTSFSGSELWAPVLHPADGRDLGKFLVQLKNGPADAQARFNQIAREFSDVTGCSIALQVTTRPSRVADSQQIEVLTVRIREQSGLEVPLEFAGAGRFEALYSTSLMAAAPGTVLCLDEPAAMLSPTMQKALLRRLQRRVAAKQQVVVVTHSPGLVPTGKPFAIARLVSEGGATELRRLPDHMANRESARLIKEFESADVRALLFANGVILVEGDEDQAALTEWYQPAVGHSPEDYNLVIHSVDGKGTMGVYMRFLTAFGIPWVALVDGDALTFGEGHDSGSIVPKVLDVLGGDPPVSGEFAEVRKWAERHGVFTVADDQKGALTQLLNVGADFEKQLADLGSSKARRARAIATLVPIPSAITAFVRTAEGRLGQPPIRQADGQPTVGSVPQDQANEAVATIAAATPGGNGGH